MSAWTRWNGLSRDERRLRRRALAVTLVTRCQLPFRRLDAVRRSAKRLAGARATGHPASRDEVERAAVSAASRVPGARCLARAVTAEALLRAHGHPARLVLGVRCDGVEGIDAHAWVDSAGTPVVPSGEIGAYEPIPVP
ncbi:MAG: lasso peptide biosynthesis B2 protein [Planctomycetota bacterium]|jgi:hypothetical protein